MNYIGLIPARYSSSRLPGKPLCDLAGETMIRRVYKAAKKWDQWKGVYVITDHDLIFKECTSNNIPVVMTRDDHLDCLDRAAEAVDTLDAKGINADRYIIIQGDEPLFNTNSLNTDLSPPVVNFYTEVKDKSELYDPNCVKVVISKSKKALYFSRHTIPYHEAKTQKGENKLICYKQLGIYSFSREELKKYTSLTPSYLECIEGIGLNRLLEYNINIDMRYTKHNSLSVDTEEDRLKVVKIINQ